MLSPELVAYPALLCAMYGAYRVGRRRGMKLTDEGFEWVRICALAVMLGVVVAVQVRLVAAGVVRSTPAIWAGAFGVAACVGLIGLHVLDFIETRKRAAGTIS